MHCLHCKIQLGKGEKKYCSVQCQKDSEYKSYIADWKKKSKNGTWQVKTKNISRHLKRYLLEESGGKCSLCGWNKRHPITGKIPLEVDHIDGNADNNNESNLRVICPNCHSLTIHFRNLNRTRGREWRIKRLQSKRNS